MCYSVMHEITDLDDILHGFPDLQEIDNKMLCISLYSASGFQLII